MIGFLGKDGRWVVIAGIAAYMGFLSMLTGPLHLGRVEVLRGLGVPAMEPLFGDTLCVAQWCDGYGGGKDPCAPDFKNPEGKVITMNYPPPILGFHYLGLSRLNIVTWGVFLGVVMLASALTLCGKCSLQEGVIWCMVLLSPSVVMAVERGNFDCLIFGLLTASCMALARPALAGVFILAGTMIKIYPLAAVVSLIMKRKPAPGPFWIFGGLCFFIGWWMLKSSSHTAGDLGQVSCCFGSKVPAFLVAGVLGLDSGCLGLIFQGTAAVMIISGVWWGGRNRHSGVRELLKDHSINAFWTGVPVCLFVFLSGDQADYKMIMMIFAMPAMLEWIRADKKQTGTWVPKLWLFLFLIYSYWLFFSDEGCMRNLLLRQLVAWALLLVTSIAGGILIPCGVRCEQKAVKA